MNASALAALIVLLFLVVVIVLLIDFACGTYFRHKFLYFKKLSSEITNTRQGEPNGEE